MLNLSLAAVRKRNLTKMFLKMKIINNNNKP